MSRITAGLIFAAITLAQLRVSTQQIAALYSTTLESSAVEFAVNYINQRQLPLNSYWTQELDISENADNETARREMVCEILSNASGVVVPKLTQLSYESISSVIYDTQFPIVVAQNTLTNVMIPDDIIIWRSTSNELLNVIQSLLMRLCPALVVLVESAEDVTISLSSVLPDTLALSDDVTVDITVVQYSANENLTAKIEDVIMDESFSDSTVSARCALNESQSGILFILNLPVYDGTTALNVTYSTTLEYRWLLLPHLTSHLDDLITTGEELENFRAGPVQGLRDDSLFTQEFIDFQNHWLSANKTMFPDSSFDTTEFAYDVYKAVLTLLDAVNASDYYNQTIFNCSSMNQMNTTHTLLPSEYSDASISHRNYTIWNITATDLSKFGRWSSDTGLEKINDGCVPSSTVATTGSTDMEFQYNYTGVHFRIVTIQEIPFVMNDTGKLRGFCIDLLNVLQKMMNFTYDIYEVEDRKFGSEEGNGTWNGIVGDIRQGEADLAVASLTINVDRIKVVDFTKPYIELGTLILLYKEPEKGFSLTRFAEPFSTGLLVVFVCSWPIVGLVAWIAARYSPYDRSALKKEKKVDALYGFSYSMWAQYGSLTLQGSEYHPLSPSGRIVVVTWWFVVLVLISCYTAQLAASLTTQNIARVIKSINDLTNQDYVKYGTVNDTEVEEFFVSSNITTYRSALPTIRDNLYPSVDAAVDKVCESEGRFAFIWDSVVIESLIAQEEDCGLCSAGSLFDRKGYGLAFPLNSNYTNDFTIAILKLRESQNLLQLRNKWIPMLDSSTCEDSSDLQYTVTDIGDVFVILGICLVLSFFVLIIEMLWKYFETSQKIEDIAMNHIWKSIKFHGNSNRTAPLPSEYHQDNGSAIKNGEIPSAPTENVDTASTKSDGNLSSNPYSVFVKEKPVLQEVA